MWVELTGMTCEPKPGREIDLTQLAKSSVIVRTFNFPLFRVSVQTFVPGRTVPVLREPPTFWHAPKVVLVQKLARVTLLTESTQPMFANGCQTLSVPRMGGELFRRLEVLGRRCRVP